MLPSTMKRPGDLKLLGFKREHIPITTISSAISGKRSLFEILFAILGNRMVFLYFFNFLKKEHWSYFLSCQKKKEKEEEKTVKEKSVSIWLHRLENRGIAIPWWMTHPALTWSWLQPWPLPEDSEKGKMPLSLGGCLFSKVFLTWNPLFTPTVHGTLVYKRIRLLTEAF